MLQNKQFDPQSILERRTLPAVIILDNRGKVLSHNCAAEQLLPLDDGCLEALGSIHKRPFQTGSRKLEPVMKTVVYCRQKMYGLQAFQIQNHSDQRSSLMVVLLEKIAPRRSHPYEDSPPFHFPPREMQVVRALELGLTDKEIASMLELSPSTVRSYLKTIRGKLGVSTRTAIVHALHSAPDHGEVLFTSKLGPSS